MVWPILNYGNRTLIKLGKNSKRPLPGYQLIRGDQMGSHDGNFGLKIPRDVIVIDIDSRNNGFKTLEECEKKWGPLGAETVQETPTGGQHRLFRRHIDREYIYKLGPGIEVLTGNRYIVVEPSTIDGGRYAWQACDCSWECTCLDQLEYLPTDWERGLRRDVLKEFNVFATTRETTGDAYENAKRYIDKCPGAVSGKGGHNHTFAIVARLRELGISKTGAMMLLEDWNRRCSPPWSRRELQHKLDSVFK